MLILKEDMGKPVSSRASLGVHSCSEFGLFGWFRLKAVAVSSMLAEHRCVHVMLGCLSPIGMENRVLPAITAS